MKTTNKLLIAVSLVIGLSSCTLTVSPDGTRTYGVDANTAARAIIIYSQK